MEQDLYLQSVIISGDCGLDEARDWCKHYINRRCKLFFKGDVWVCRNMALNRFDRLFKKEINSSVRIVYGTLKDYGL